MAGGHQLRKARDHVSGRKQGWIHELALAVVANQFGFGNLEQAFPKNKAIWLPLLPKV